jgi:hypothetical protein
MAVVVLSAMAAGAQNFGVPQDEYYDLEWQLERGNGRPRVAGYFYNKRNLRAWSVQLRVAELDAAGSVVNQTFGWVYGDVPSRGRGYFRVPVRSANAAYQVTVHSIHWRHHRSLAR